MFVTRTVPLDALNWPFQEFVTDVPDGSASVTVQPLIGVPPAVTVTVATNPPDQELPTE
jgi:hypothetical protein